VDPDANLAEQLSLARQMLDAYGDEAGNGIDQDDAARLADLVLALDEWLRNGGFQPGVWR
jgi:hypothetical protein